MFGTEVDFIETLKSRKSRRSMSSTVSTAAVTSASTGFVNSRSRRWRGQRAGVHADADRRAELLGLRDDLGDLLGAADVARVQPHAVRAGVERLERERVVEVDVGDDRDRRLAHDRPQRLGVLLARDGDPDEVGAGVGDAADLVHRGLQVGGLRLGHRLDGDRRAAPDGDAADVDLPLRGHGSMIRTGRGPGCLRLGVRLGSRAAARAPGLAPGRPRPGAPARGAVPAHRPAAGDVGARRGLRDARAAGPGARPRRHRRRPGRPSRLPRAVRPGRRGRGPALPGRRVRPGLRLVGASSTSRPRAGRASRPSWPASRAASTSRRRPGRSRSSRTRCCRGALAARGGPAPVLAPRRPGPVGGRRAAAPLGAQALFPDATVHAERVGGSSRAGSRSPRSAAEPPRSAPRARA